MNRRHRRSFCRRFEGQDGSILIAVMIIMIVLTLVTAVAVQVIGNQSIVGARQATAQAVSLADGGISDALFRLDQGGSVAGYNSSSGTWSSFCVGPTGCAATSIPGTPNVTYKVVPNNSSNPSSWTVYSKATSGAQHGAVVETVSKTAQWPFALFTKQSMVLNGTSNMTWTTYSSSSSVPDNSQTVAIGSDGTLSCNGNLSNNVQPSYYQANGSTTGAQCGSPTTTDYQYPTPVAPTNPTPSTCPNQGQLGSTAVVAGASSPYPTLGASGTTTTILCQQPVTISGQLQILGSVNLYVILSPAAPSGYSEAISLAGGSYINDPYDYCVNVTLKNPNACLNNNGLPSAPNFQVYTNSTLDVGDTNGKGLYFAGVIDAPLAGMTEDGCKGVWYGALILSSFTCNGGSSGFTMNYDDALTTIYGPVVLNGYRQVPPSSFTVP